MSTQSGRITEWSTELGRQILLFKVGQYIFNNNQFDEKTVAIPIESYLTKKIEGLTSYVTKR